MREQGERDEEDGRERRAEERIRGEKRDICFTPHGT